MSPVVFAVVLAAAVLHASWNALVKSGGDPYLRLAIVNLTHTVAVLPLLPLVPLPDAAAWPWLLGSVFTHLAYYLLLAASYRVGDERTFRFDDFPPVAAQVIPVRVVAVSAHAVAFVHRGDHPACEGQGVGGVLCRRQAELAEQRRALVEDVADALDQRFAEGAVGDEKEADHGVLRSLRF